MVLKAFFGSDLTLAYCLNCTEFGQLILSKIIKICHQMSDFKAKMHQIRRWGAYSAGLKGPTCKGRKGAGRAMLNMILKSHYKPHFTLLMHSSNAQSGRRFLFNSGGPLIEAPKAPRCPSQKNFSI